MSYRRGHFTSELKGLVSISDVVKLRMEELQRKIAEKKFTKIIIDGDFELSLIG